MVWATPDTDLAESVEYLWLIGKGVVAGLVLSAPLGPVALLCARRSLIFGTFAGLISGLGAATADMFYAVVAAFGLTVISEWLELHRLAIDVVGGGLLVVLGIYLLLVRPKPTDLPSQRQLEPMDAPHAFGATFALTIANPITLVTFIVLFDYLRAGDVGDRPGMAALLVGGVFAGSMFWWVSLSLGAGRLAGRLGLDGERILNRVCAVVMLGFGAYGLLRAL